MKGCKLNMNKYETVIIINNNITQEQKNDVIKRIEKYISENGNITFVKDLGTKKLAYQINKNNYGYYYIIEFESKAEIVLGLERLYRIIEEVLKFIVVRKEDN